MGDKLPTYGGQALIEGVLMRGTTSLTAAMRAPDGEIVLHTEKLTGVYKSSIRKFPFIRGIFILWDALGLGMRYLTISANLQAPQDEKIEGKTLVGTIAFSLLLAVGLFFVTPAAVSQLVEKWVGLEPIWGSVLEGILRLSILVGYVWGVGKIPEIGRVFAYHGAEHKTINAFEAGSELTPEKVKQFTLAHPRCGTAFLLTLVVLSILFFSILGPMPFALRMLSRIILIPILASLAYEYIRWSANHLNSKIIQILIAPNLALQKLTTREPDEKMLEVAISALKSVLSNEKNKDSLPI